MDQPRTGRRAPERVGRHRCAVAGARYANTRFVCTRPGRNAGGEPYRDVRMTRSAAKRSAVPPRKRPHPARMAAPRRGPDPVEEELYRLITDALIATQL